MDTPYRFAVVTKLLPGHNWSDSFALPDDDDVLNQESATNSKGQRLYRIRVEVWTLAEILILYADNDREVCGRDRKWTKWGITVEIFDTLEKAVNRSRLLRSSGK